MVRTRRSAAADAIASKYLHSILMVFFILLFWLSSWVFPESVGQTGRLPQRSQVMHSYFEYMEIKYCHPAYF
jgi:hypothetical protein